MIVLVVIVWLCGCVYTGVDVLYMVICTCLEFYANSKFQTLADMKVDDRYVDWVVL